MDLSKAEASDPEVFPHFLTASVSEFGQVQLIRIAGARLTIRPEARDTTKVRPIQIQ